MIIALKLVDKAWVRLHENFVAKTITEIREVRFADGLWYEVYSGSDGLVARINSHHVMVVLYG